MNDFKFALRRLLKNPGFTAVAVLTLALGIGANTFIFSFVNRTYFRPLPFPEPDQLVEISMSDREGELNELTPAQFLRVRDQAETMSQVEAMHPTGFNMTSVDEPVSLAGARVTAGFFDVFQIRPALGRTFHESEDQAGGPKVAILSHGIWQRHFGGRPDVIGRIVHLNLTPHEVIGVLPQSFDLPIEAGYADNLWVPIQFSADEIRTGGANLAVIGRLKDNVSLTQAQAEIAVVAANLRSSFVDSDADNALRVSPMKPYVGRTTHMVWIMLSIAGAFVLLIACANVSNLILARAVTRRKEMAIRLAIGANRRRIVQQALSEALLLAALGALAGVILALWSVQLVAGRTGESVPFDSRVLAFTLGVLLATGVACAVFPALLTTRTDLNSTLKDGGTISNQRLGRFRVGQAFVVVQLALSLSLLLGAGLMIRNLIAILRVEPGFDKQGILSVDVYLPAERYTNQASRVTFFERAVEEITNIPGVREAGAAGSFPIHASFSRQFTVADSHPDSPQKNYATINQITENYLSMMKIPLRAGRDFSEAESGAAEVAIIDETMEQRFFGEEHPIGKTITVDVDSGRWKTFTIIGIAANVMNVGSRRELERPAPVIYLPYGRFPPTTMTLLVRGNGAVETLAPVLRRILREMDPDLPIRDIRTVEERILQIARRNNSLIAVLGVFAACGLVLAAVGVFGVVAYTVARQTHEIGVRMALGARRGNICGLYVWQGMKMVIVACAMGVVAGFILTRGMERMLYGVSTIDPVTYVIVPFFLMGVTLLASFLPARRAAKINPIDALRHE